MNTENTKKLFDHFPRLYAELTYFECGDEYFEVIYKLSEDLCALADRGFEPDDLCFDRPEGFYPTATQVKEKFNKLRFYACVLSSDMRELINQAGAVQI